MSDLTMPAAPDLREWLAKRLYVFQHMHSRIAVSPYGDYERELYLPRADYFLKTMREAGFEVAPVAALAQEGTNQ